MQHLADQGKAGWQIERAEAALKLLHQSRYPAPWSADWKVRHPLAAATASPERRRPLDEEFLRARHQGKSDRGELPPRFAPFIDEIRAAVRALPGLRCSHVLNRPGLAVRSPLDR